MSTLALIFLSLVAVSFAHFGSPGGVMNPMMNRLLGCNPPRTLKGAFQILIRDNLRTDDDIIDTKDFIIDGMDYDYDGNPCQIFEWEMVYHWQCVYGLSAGYARWFFKRADPSGQGYIDVSKSFGGASFTLEQFRNLQYDRLANVYCNDTANLPDSSCDKVKQETKEMVLGK